YLGGKKGDGGNGIAVDSFGNAYIAGFTESRDFPVANALQAAFGGDTRSLGESDAFVTKLNPSGSALIYSTYLGGSGADMGSAIEVDSTGNVYVTGYTRSLDFPITRAPQTMLGSESGDAFVTKLNIAGSVLVYSSYLGGGNYDYGAGIAVDVAGN